MYKFYMDNQRIIHKLLINQIAISALGLMIFFPVNAIISQYGLGEIPFLLAGLFTAAMYFFVIYDMCWEWGTKYISKKDIGPSTKTVFSVAAFSYIPTLIIILAYFVCFIAKLNAINVFKWILLLLCGGMHFGTIQFSLGFLPENMDAAAKGTLTDGIIGGAFVLATLLAILVCVIGFKVGKSGKTLFAGYFHKKPENKK